MSSHPLFSELESAPKTKRIPKIFAPKKKSPPQSNKFLLPAGKVCQWSAPQPPFLDLSRQGHGEFQGTIKTNQVGKDPTYT